MKRFKRVIALLIIAVLVMSMGMGAMASDDETETKNPINGAIYDHVYFTPEASQVDLIGHSFNAVQVIAAESYDTTSKEYTGISWGAQITEQGVVTLLTALQADDTLKDDFKDFVSDPASVDQDHPLFTAAAFADVIQGYIGSDHTAEQEALIKVIKGLNLTGQSFQITEDMEPVELTAGIGLYMIDDTTTASSLQDDVVNASILMAVPGSNNVRIKVDKPTQDKKVKENASLTWNEVSDYNIGDYVPYRITSKIPTPDKFENYTMTFTDEMSTGLTFADTVQGVADANKLKITVGGSTLAAPADYTLTPSAHSFTLELPVKTSGEMKYTAGAEIVIEFYGQLNQSAVIGTDGNTNRSKLTYSNDPDSNSTTDTTWDTVITFTYELDVEKIDGVTTEALPGAQFALKAATGEHTGKYAIVNASGILTGWSDTKPQADDMTNGALLVADKDGKFKVVGLDDGEYTLTEVKAPAGYNAIPDVVVKIEATTANGSDYTDDLENTAANALTKLEVNVPVDGQDSVQEGNTTTGAVEIVVENNSGATLPDTGGAGTTMFYMIGAALMIGAGAVLASRRRMGVQ